MNIKKCLVAVLSIIMIFSELSISASADTKPKFDGKTKINTLPGCIEQVDVIGVKHTNCKAKSSNSKIKIKKSYWTDYTYFFISANEKAKGKISFYYRKDANSEFKKLKTIFFKCCSKSEAKSKLKKSLNNKTIKIGKGQLSSIKPFKNYNEKYKIRFVSKKPKQLVIDKKKLNKKDDSDVFEWLSENEIVTNSLNVFSKKCGKLKINVYYTGTKRPIFIGSLNVKTIT
ncbi:MAG: hypothetical protein IJO19_03715, partial [Clostridia bacterium]|nr:hypothetical protein [Clostridia bacterium]